MDLVFPAFVPGMQRLDDCLRAVAREGVTAVEWGLGSARYFDEKDPEEVRAAREALESTGVRPHSLHTIFGERADIGSVDLEVRAAALALQRHAIHVAGRIGARYLIVHPGHGPGGQDRAERLDLAVDALRALEPLARAAGVVLAVENLPPGYPGDGAADLLAMMDALDSPWVGICFDAGHAHLAGDVHGMARALLPRTVTMHLHDNDGSKDQHLLPGRGTMDWADFARVYAETGCRAAGMLECAPPDGWPWDRCAAEVRRLLGLSTPLGS